MLLSCITPDQFKSLWPSKTYVNNTMRLKKLQDLFGQVCHFNQQS